MTVKNKFLRLAFFLPLIASCISEPDIISLVSPSPAEVVQRPAINYVEDYRGRSEGVDIPEWVRFYLDGGNQGVEAMGIFRHHYVFVVRSSGSSFMALNHWLDNFSPELDFPRLAAARIEARYLLESPLPDIVFGDFYISLIRAVSDHEWTGAVMYDYFWMHTRPSPQEPAVWEFMILCIIPRGAFSSQYNIIYNDLNSRIFKTWEQQRALNRLAPRFYEGF